jgi:hypothetical protein
MNEKEFIMWLHGYLEISGANTLGEEELQVIKDHLKEFFVKVTPERHKAPKDKSVPDPSRWPGRRVNGDWPLIPINPYVPNYIPPNVDPNRIICQEPAVTYCTETPPKPKAVC